MEISFEHSLAWILPILAMASAIAWWVYFYKKPYDDWSTNLKRFLTILRWSALLIVAILLLKPFLITDINVEEKPKLLLYLDGSASVDSTEVEGIKNRFETDPKIAEKYDLKIFFFGDGIWKSSEPMLDQRLNTDLGNVLTSVQDFFFNENIGAVVLASDGIQTKGLNPTQVKLTTTAPVYTLALGDSSTAPDFELSQVLNNKMVFLGNDFQIKVRALATNLSGESALIKLTKSGVVLEEKKVDISSSNQAIEVDFTTKAEVVGVNEFNVYIEPNEAENNTDNNFLRTFIEVLDNRTRVNILAKSPHPDLSALKAAIAAGEQYEVKTQLIENWDRNIEDYDLFILHGIPNNESDAALIQSIKKKAKPIFLVFTSSVNIEAFNTLQLGLKISGKAKMTEQVEGALNNNFNLFAVESNDKLKRFPPLWSPFGNYQATLDHQTLFFQSIGQIKTEKPLLAFYNDGDYKSGLLMAEGWWRWRLVDQEIDKTRWTDQLIAKTVQYLALKQKRNNLIVTAPKQISERQNLVFKAEFYNQTFELVNDVDINLIVEDSLGQTFEYKFLNANNAFQVNIGSLPVGAYRWRAIAKPQEIQIIETGEFNVIENKAEFIRTRADFLLLSKIADSKGGKMYTAAQTQQLISTILNLENAKSVIHTNRDWKSVIEWKWLLFIILGLLTVEWFLRKYNGNY